MSKMFKVKKKKTLIGLLEMKTTICEMENTLSGNSKRLDIAIKNISECEDTANRDYPKMKLRGKKRLKK